MLLYSFVVLVLHILLGVELRAFAFQKSLGMVWFVWTSVFMCFLCSSFGPLRPDAHALGYEFDPLGPANFLDHV